MSDKVGIETLVKTKCMHIYYFDGPKRKVNSHEIIFEHQWTFDACQRTKIKVLELANERFNEFVEDILFAQKLFKNRLEGQRRRENRGKQL